MEFKERIRELRKRRNMSQAQLAVVLGKSESAVRAWEINRAKPDADTLIFLSEYFGCTTDYLLGRNNFESYDEILAALDLDGRLSDLLATIPGGLSLLEEAVYLLEVLEEKDFKFIADKYFSIAKLLKESFQAAYKSRDDAINPEQFDFNGFLDCILNTTIKSNEIKAIVDEAYSIVISNIYKSMNNAGSEKYLSDKTIDTLLRNSFPSP